MPHEIRYDIVQRDKARIDEKARVAAQLQEVERLHRTRMEELEDQVRELRNRMELGP